LEKLIETSSLTCAPGTQDLGEYSTLADQLPNVALADFWKLPLSIGTEVPGFCGAAEDGAGDSVTLLVSVCDEEELSTASGDGEGVGDGEVSWVLGLVEVNEK